MIPYTIYYFGLWLPHKFNAYSKLRPRECSSKKKRKMYTSVGEKDKSTLSF